MNAAPGQLSAAAPPTSGRRRGAIALVAGTAVAVAAIHLLLLALVRPGWLTLDDYAAAAAVLSGAAVGAIVHLARRKALLSQLRPKLDGETAKNAAEGRPQEVHPALMELQRQSRERLLALKRSHEQERQRGDAHLRLAEHLKRAQRIARVGSWEWQRSTQRVTCSEEVFRLLGLATGAGPESARLIELVHEDDRRAMRRWILDVARARTSQGLDVRLRGRDGEMKFVHLLGEALHSGEQVAGVAGTIQDATERTQAIQQIHKLAYYDVLTELPNRSRFHEKLAETLEVARRAGRTFALLFLDLDQFKRINDTLGHHVGDDLLRVVAQRLKSAVRTEESGILPRGRTLERDVCRQGGDEFIVLLDGVESEDQATRAAERVIERLAQPIVIGEQEMFVSASIGIVLYPRDGEDLDTLLKNADIAMYHAKSEGRSSFAFYDASMRQATARRLSLEHDLRRAIEGEQFELHYQPQVDMGSGRIVGMEALVRWNHPTLGMLWPQHFIGVAEEAGLIGAIWEWVFVTALIQHNAWRQAGLPPIPIGVNLSSIQFAEVGLAQRVTEIAQVVGVPFEHIELELTESVLVKDWDKALATLEALRATGIRIAVDDFGTGYSSLSCLRQLPFDKLKLDHAFTTDAAADAKGAAIARAIIAMARSLELTVVAEGVETQHQIDTLTAMGCTIMQGYLLSRPLGVAAMTELLHRRFPARGAAQAEDARVREASTTL